MTLRDHYGEPVRLDEYAEHLWSQTTAPTPVEPHPYDVSALGWWPWHAPVAPTVVALEPVKAAASRLHVDHRRLTFLARGLGHHAARLAPAVWDAIIATAPPSVILPGRESLRVAAARLGIGRSALEKRTRGRSVRGGLLPSQWDAIAAQPRSAR